MTNMEIATLFYVRCNELYLTENAETAFVMPRSVFSADHHANFRKGSFTRVKFAVEEIWDLDKVKPLFKIPACVVFARKNRKNKTPIKTEVFKGRLNSENENYNTAIPKLSIEDKKLYDSRIGKRTFFSYEQIDYVKKSHYYKKVFRGAEILPQGFWLVEIQREGLGYNAKKPYVKTPRSVMRAAKKPWRDILFEGNIESDFLYEVVTASHLFPFCYRTALAVLPIRPTRTGYRIIDSETAIGDAPNLSIWLKNAESHWRRGRKQKKKFDIYQWIDYHNKLTRQNPQKKFKVVYNKRGKDVVAAVVQMESHNSRVILAEATIYYETNNIDEAYYLASLLNAPKINQLIKPMQSKGLWGERGVDKKLLEIPFPPFNGNKEYHRKLVRLGLEANEIAQSKLEIILQESKDDIKPQQIGRIRAKIRASLSTQLSDIDVITKKLLKEQMTQKNNMDKFLK
jgi:hypothetical protein